MGKGTILSGGQDGLYTVRIDFGTAQRDAQVTALAARVAALTTQIAGWQITLDAFKTQEEAPALAAVNAAITDYASAAQSGAAAGVLKIKSDAHTKAMRALLDVRSRYALLLLQLDRLKIELAQAIKDKTRWESLVLEQERAVWCADATDDAAPGEAATIEIPGEYGDASTAVVIAPGAPAPAANRGAIVAREVQTGPQAFFNAAILPGWQKHKPTYRAGTIAALNRSLDQADVDLDPAKSSAQQLDINRSESLSAVPVQYMTCNASAFEVGDRVVVEFQGQSWDQPRVIGFVERPKRCERIVISRTGSRIETKWSDVFGWYDVGVPYNAEWMLFDPATGETSLWGERLADNYTEPSTYAISNIGAFFLNGKTWTEREARHEHLPMIDANDGESVVFSTRYASISVDGNEIVSLVYAYEEIVILDAQTFAYKRSAGWRTGARYIKAKFGWAVMHGVYDYSWMRVLDHVTGATIRELNFGDDVIEDIAISRHFVAVLVVGWFSSVARVELYAREDLSATGAAIPISTFTLPAFGLGYDAMAMTDKHIILCRDLGVDGNGTVDVYRIVDGDLVFGGNYYPWRTLVDSAYMWAGN